MSAELSEQLEELSLSWEVRRAGGSTKQADQRRTDSGDLEHRLRLSVTDKGTSLDIDSLERIEPIAEALIKTLAGKARTSRLDELKALELLQQAMMQ